MLKQVQHKLTVAGTVLELKNYDIQITIYELIVSKKIVNLKSAIVNHCTRFPFNRLCHPEFLFN